MSYAVALVVLVAQLVITCWSEAQRASWERLFLRRVSVYLVCAWSSGSVGSLCFIMGFILCYLLFSFGVLPAYYICLLYSIYEAARARYCLLLLCHALKRYFWGAVCIRGLKTRIFRPTTVHLAWFLTSFGSFQ